MAIKKYFLGIKLECLGQLFYTFWRKSVFADKNKDENVNMRSDVKHHTASCCDYSNTKMSYIKLIAFLVFHKTLLHFKERHYS